MFLMLCHPRVYYPRTCFEIIQCRPIRKANEIMCQNPFVKLYMHLQIANTQMQAMTKDIVTQFFCFIAIHGSIIVPCHAQENGIRLNFFVFVFY